jgi:hypothetical protein
MHRISPRRTLAALALATLAVSGLATAGDAAAATPQATSVVRTIGLGASGKTLTLAPSHRLKIVLRTAVDGGYRWVITHHPNRAVITISKPKLTAYPHQPGTVGYPYRTTYVVTAVGTGSARIGLAERGPGSPADVAERFTLRVHVRTSCFDTNTARQTS